MCAGPLRRATKGQVMISQPRDNRSYRALGATLGAASAWLAQLETRLAVAIAGGGDLGTLEDDIYEVKCEIEEIERLMG